MTKAAQSIFVFGWYMAAEGVILLLVPNTLLYLVQLPDTSEIWIRLLGVALLVLGYYYIRAAKTNLAEFFSWTVHMRLAQFVIISCLVLFGFGQPLILVFAGIEAAAGLWTLSVLRK